MRRVGQGNRWWRCGYSKPACLGGVAWMDGCCRGRVRQDVRQEEYPGRLQPIGKVSALG